MNDNLFTATGERSEFTGSIIQSFLEAGGLGLSDVMYKQIRNTYGAQMQMSTEQQAVSDTNTLIDREV